MDTCDEEDMDFEFDGMDTSPHPLLKKGQKLNRAEKSRIAAQSRRNKEAAAMQILMKELPISMEVLNKMDKASVIRLAICYLKIKHYVQKDMVARVIDDKNRICAAPSKAMAIMPPGQTTRPDEGNLMLNALNGFVIMINCKGNIRFVSTTVEEHLGYKQIQLIGKNIVDFIHPSHREELAKQFSQEHKYDMNGSTGVQQVFYLKMKYNLPKPGGKTKHTGFTLVHWSGKMKRHRSRSGEIKKDGLLCICRPMQTTSIAEVRMDGNMFMSRHDLGMTFTYCDARIVSLVGYEPNEVIGKTAYHFHNPIDAPKVGDCHQNLIVKGTSVSKYYRFLSKLGSWVWLQTRATIIYNTSNKPQYVICMNYLISEEEGERYLMLEEHKHANDHTNVIEIPNSNFTAICESNCKRARITELNDSAVCNVVRDVEARTLPETDFFSSNNQQNSPESNVVQESLVSSFDHGVLLEEPLDGQLRPACYQPGEQVEDRRDLIMQLLQSGSPDSSIIQQNYTSDSVSSNDVTGVMSPPITENRNMPNDMLVSGSPLSQNVEHHGDQLLGYAQVAVCPSNEDIGGYEDAGYESASSPYSSKHNSPPEHVSHACADNNEENVGDYFTADPDQSYIRGKDCSIAGCYPDKPHHDICSSAIYRKDNGVEGLVAEDSDILDKLLESLVSADTTNLASTNLDTNMATIFSTIQSFVSNTTGPQTTTVQKPSPEAPFKVLSAAKATDKPLLWSLLKCPEDDIPKTPVSSPTNMGKNGCQSPGTPGGSVCGDPMSPASIASPSQDPMVNPMVNPMTQLPVLQPSDISNESRATVSDADVDMPKEVSDFALQYLDGQYLDGLLDSGNHSVLTGFGESVMDTSEDVDVGKLLLSSLGEIPVAIKDDIINNDKQLSEQCQTTQAFQKSRLFPKSECPRSAISMSTCNVASPRVPASSQCSSPSQGNTMLDSYRVFAVPHNDHGYHQNANKLNIVHKGRSQPVCDNRSAKTLQCNSQTQTRMSELEMCLRGIEKGYNSGCTSSCSSDSSTPFLEQLLTGELTNDRYMEMEYDRSNGKKPR